MDDNNAAFGAAFPLKADGDISRSCTLFGRRLGDMLE
jgi:hypothetical protein